MRSTRSVSHTGLALCMVDIVVPQSQVSHLVCLLYLTGAGSAGNETAVPAVTDPVCAKNKFQFMA